jgi:ketosteroid isomerase-like protein
MSNVDVVKSGYEAFNEGNLEGVQEVFAEDVRWEGTNDERVPGAGTHDGRDGAMQALQEAVDAFDSINSQPDEMIEAENTIIVLGHTEAKTKSGNDIKVPFVHIWRMEDEKIKRGQLLTDTAVILDALESDSDSDDDEDKDEDEDE